MYGVCHAQNSHRRFLLQLHCFGVLQEYQPKVLQTGLVGQAHRVLLRRFLLAQRAQR
jgi:hypothetical protein